MDINYWAVLLAALSSMVIGSIWYAKGVFGATWMRLAKVDKNKPYSMPVALGLTFLASLVTAYVLTHLIFLGSNTFSSGYLENSLITAFWAWLGLTAVRFLTHDLFEGRPWKLTLLNVTNEFITIMVMGLIIGLMRG